MHRWLRIIACALAVVVTAGLAVPTIGAQEGAEDTFVAGEIVVQLANAADLQAVARTFALTPTPLDQFGSRPIYRLRINDGATSPAKAAALANDTRVIAAEPNYLGQTPEGRAKSSWAGGGDEGDYVGQWAPAKLGLPEAHQRTRGGGVTVAVLDTGVDPTHPDLTGRLVGGYDFVDLDNDPREEDATADAYGHGTHVAGLIALAAPEAQILPVRMLDPDGIGNLWVTIEALSYAVNPDGDPATDDGADVINLSFSFLRRSELLETIVREVVCEDDDDDDDDACSLNGGHGAVVAAAAGNNGSTTPEYPAAESIRGLLSVAATTQADALASFSNRGPWVNISAPGAQIVSSVPGGGYGTWSGTSMSAPLIAGSAALLRAFDSSLDPATTAAQLIATGAPVRGIAPRVDAAAMLRPPVDLTCRSLVVGKSVANLTVPSGATCTLRGTRIKGTLLVERGATLLATNVSVSGNVQASEGKSVAVDNADVDGTLQIEKSSGRVRIIANNVAGDIQVKDNTGGVTIMSNQVQGNLQCEGNRPAPTGRGNRAKQLEGQCRRLAGHAVYLPSILSVS